MPKHVPRRISRLPSAVRSVCRHSLPLLLIAASAPLLALPAIAASENTLVPVSSVPSPTLLAKPALAATGGELILSDDPEEIGTSDNLPGALYRDNVDGLFRVFGHQQNNTSQSFNVGVAVTNTTKSPIFLFGGNSGQGVNYYPDVAGQDAMTEFLGQPEAFHLLTRLRPGASYWTTVTDPATDTASTIADFAALAPRVSLSATSGDLPSTMGFSDGRLAIPPGLQPSQVTVTTSVFVGSPPVEPLALPVLPSDGSHIRGTFPHFARSGTLAVDACAGPQALNVDTAPPGDPYSNDMPGEYELGTDAVDGGNAVYDDGNYGVVYHFSVDLDRTAGCGQQPVALLMIPSGGSGQYVEITDHQLELSPYVSYVSAWWFDESSPTDRHISLVTSLTGGSSGPQEFIFYPGFKGA